MDRWEAIAWPWTRAGEALEALAAASGTQTRAAEAPALPREVAEEPEKLSRWFEGAAAWLGVELEAVESTHGEARGLVQRAGPALLRLPEAGPPRLLLLLRRRSQARVVMLAPSGAEVDVAVDALVDDLTADIGPAVREHMSRIDGLLARAAVAPGKRRRIARAMLDDQLERAMLRDRCWLLRARPGEGLLAAARGAGLGRYLAALLLAHVGRYLLFLLSWLVIGRGLLSGRIDPGWLTAWALALLTMVPLQMLATWSQGHLAIGAGALLKQRQLWGALHLDPEQVRGMGIGQLLGRVIESETVEALALGGGLAALLAVIELALAAAVLTAGATGPAHALALALWLALALVLLARHAARLRRWVDARLAMTNDLVERMLGHRTRLVQQPRARWHDGEDHALDRYLELARSLDRAAHWLVGLVPRGWLVVSLALLLAALLTGGASTSAAAITLGGALLAHRALEQAVRGATQLAAAYVAWQRAAPLIRAPEPGDVGDPMLAALGELRSAAREPGAPVLVAHDLVFAYAGRRAPVIEQCSFAVRGGEKVLLEGPSGAGKSTLGALITGLRRPQSGLLLVHGLDRQTLGSSGWRRWVVSVPQFHENHVLSGTLAFNLLMGRRWPALARDEAEAHALCEALGLGELLARMPAGMGQMIGETGWQLSHGERSRVFIARALLQGADVVVFDESFAALDPENLQRALACALARAPTAIVIAHP